MIMISKALRSLYPNSEFIIEDEDIDKVRWIKNPPEVMPSIEQLHNEVERLNQLDITNAYKQNRKTEYPSIQEQLDMQYWDKINGTNTWEQAIQAVKQKYPKPE